MENKTNVNKKVMVTMLDTKKPLEGKILIDKSENIGYCILINGSVHYNVHDEFIKFID